MARSHDLAWAAGVFEGEGCICCYKIPNRKDSRRVMLAITMSDEDIVQRIYEIFKVGSFKGPYKKKDKKTLWTWAVQNMAGCHSVLTEIYPYLGKRRKEKADEMIKEIENRPKWKALTDV